MKDILFYIFASITLLSAMYIAFSVKSGRSIKALPYFITGLAGFFVLLNFHMFSLLSVLILLILFSGIFLFRDKISHHVVEANHIFRVNLISLIIMGILTAVFAGLPGAAKWPQFDIMFGSNSLALIFTKYIAAIIGIGFLVSVIISAGYNILKNEAAK